MGRQFVYQDGNVLNFFGSPEGWVVKNGSNFEYQYAIADHQGNTRVVFTSATPAPVAPVVTFEGDANDGASQYLNVNASNVVSFTAANHTSGGTKVIRMNQSYKVGPSKSVKVYPGDKVDMEVWEYHEGTSGFGTNTTPLTTLITMVSGVFGGVSGGGGESGLIYSGVNSAITTFGSGGNQGSTRPAAYLNYILFDQNYNVLNMGWQLAPATTFTKQKLSFSTLNIKEPGYVFVFLSYDNDSNNWVYFDDLKVTHTKSNVIQYNEYYPFGLQNTSSWTRENNSNNYLYNAGNELNQTSGWYETFFRGYDAVLGRFHQVDAMAYAASSYTPYTYAFNSPTIFNDPNGDYPREVQMQMEQHQEYLRNGGGTNVVSPFQRVGPSYGNHWSNQYRSIDSNASVMSTNNFLGYYGLTGASTAEISDFVVRNGLGVSTSDPVLINLALGGFDISKPIWADETTYEYIGTAGNEHRFRKTENSYLISSGVSSGQGGPQVLQAGMGTDVTLSLLSTAAYAAGVYEDARAAQIAKNTKGYLKEWQQIRNFNKGYKTARQATLASNIIKNVNMLDGIKLGARRMIGVGTVLGLLDVANSKPEERMGKLGWVAADAIMAGVGLTGWGAPIAGIYFLGRFAYGIYEMSNSD